MITPAVVATATSRILVVDDEVDICTVCSLTLRRDEHMVTTTSNPAHALTLLEHEDYDLLLTDITMPTMSGLELAREAQGRQPLLDVVIMTARASFEMLEDALQQGVADFLPKPFDVDQLRITVARTLQRQRLRRENVRLQTLTHVIEAGRAFATSLDRTYVAETLVAAVQREWGGACAHVVLGTDTVLPPPGAHAECALLAAEVDVNQLLEVPLQANGKTLGQLWLAVGPSQSNPQHNEVVQLLVEHGSLALYNAETYSTLADLDHQKSEFIALVSHELRTPLSVVLGYGAMLHEKLEGRQRDHITHVVQSALRINDLFDDLINLRRFERGEQLVQFETVEFHALLATLYHELLPLATARGVTFGCCAPRRAIHFRAERERLLLALAHLITNALRFTPRGGRVMITGGQQQDAAGGNLLVAVDDTGIGIQPHEVQRIFQRFYQVSDSRTREQGGLGIGLPLARHIIELHGGSLSVQSIHGRGSRFVATLPATLLFS